MKNQILFGLFAAALSFGTVSPVLASAENASTAASIMNAESVVQNYAALVFEKYSNTLSEAQKMNALVKVFTNDPTEANLAAVKVQWTEARKLYSQTEVFRFYAGPIDSEGSETEEGGPEGLMNAWPLDEAYIDYVRGDANSGLINDAAQYPSLDKVTLMALNENGGEKNISTGWHAIEFILWGQDFSTTGPGNRPVSDFTTAANAGRRKQYLETTSDLLIEHLTFLANAWDPAIAGNYAASFVDPRNLQTSLTNLFTGTIQLAGFELSQERMYVAYEEQLEEDEHSCFSDTTHFDILFNFIGIRNVVNETGLLELIRNLDPRLAAKIETSLVDTEANILSIPTPFDQALFSEEGGVAILASVTSLEDLGDVLKKAAQSLNAYATPTEGAAADESLTEL